MGIDFGGVFGTVSVLVSGAGVASGVVELLAVEFERSELTLETDEPEAEVPNDFRLGVNDFDLVFVFALVGDEVGRRRRV